MYVILCALAQKFTYHCSHFLSILNRRSPIFSLTAVRWMPFESYVIILNCLGRCKNAYVNKEPRSTSEHILPDPSYSLDNRDCTSTRTYYIFLRKMVHAMISKYGCQLYSYYTRVPDCGFTKSIFLLTWRLSYPCPSLVWCCLTIRATWNSRTQTPQI